MRGLVALMAIALYTGWTIIMPTSTYAKEKPLYVATIQLKVNLSMYKSQEAFSKRIDSMLREVSKKVPKGSDVLVTFPEDVGIFLVLAGAPDQVYKAKDLQQAIERLIKANFIKVAWTRVTKRVGWVRALALCKQREMNGMYVTTFSSLAKKYGYWISAGTTISPDFNDKGKGLSKEVFNVAYTFGPDGKRANIQKKVDLTPIETKEYLDVVPGKLKDITTFQVADHKVGVAVCKDAFFTDDPGVLTQLCKSGPLDVLIQPSGNIHAWDDWQQKDWLRSIYNAVAVDKRAKVGLNPMLVGNILGLVYEGQSSIVVTPSAGDKGTLGYQNPGPMPGFVMVADTATDDAVLVYKVD